MWFLNVICNLTIIIYYCVYVRTVHLLPLYCLYTYYIIIIYIKSSKLTEVWLQEMASQYLNPQQSGTLTLNPWILDF